jgi:starch phosphorylase
MEGNTHFFTVFAKVPERLKPLEDLAYNLWFAWNTEAVELFQRVDPRLWDETRHNPVLLLSRLSPERLAALENDDAFLGSMDRVFENFKKYQERPYFNNNRQIRPHSPIAYFSAEYGLTDCLPFFHGGLGVLAADHLKSASDLNLPIVGMGLLYQFGAFRQILTVEGDQQEIPREIDFYHMPMRLEKDPDDTPRTIQVEYGDEVAVAQIWRVDVGRVPLYLLDTNIPQNPPHIRQITVRLYAEERESRLKQEMLLGIGGVRALRALGLNPVMYHMNEGHSAFAGLERIRLLREQKGVAFDVALLTVMASNCFTTHTSVPAGIEFFDPKLIKTHLSPYLTGLDISATTLLGLGRREPENPSEPFCMNILAMKLSGHINGVSRLHKQISQRLWYPLWPSIPVEDVPITSITNGIHIPSWISPDAAILYRHYLGPHWSEDPDNTKVWSRVTEIPDEELWDIRERRRVSLVSFCRRRLHEQLIRRGASSTEIAQAKEILSPDALTIIWARRMAGYKRPTLIFKDTTRLARILNHPTRPVQIILAGKAHHGDAEAKGRLKEIISFIREEPFRRHMVFIEDYNLDVARYLVEGADIWLNTPRRPNEACGTSGMKAVANGALHMSTLDGWWAEAYHPEVGWLIGSGEDYNDVNYQDEIETKSLYNLLEHEVIPLFYDRGPDGLPREWIKRMKTSMLSLCPRFNTHRMLEEYTKWFYLPAQKYVEGLSADQMAEAQALAAWCRKMEENWSQVAVKEVKQEGPDELAVGEAVTITALVQLGEVAPEDVKVEVYYGRSDPEGRLIDRRLLRMEPHQRSENGDCLFRTTLVSNETGKFGYRIRIAPHHAYLMPAHYFQGSLVTWG